MLSLLFMSLQLIRISKNQETNLAIMFSLTVTPQYVSSTIGDAGENAAALRTLPSTAPQADDRVLLCTGTR